MATGTVDSINAASLTAPQRKTLQALKRPVMDIAAKFSVIREKLSDLAPRVIKLFNQIVADNEGFSFVEFCRLFDPTIPTHAADRDGEIGYRNHRVYYTLAYMRRNVQNARTGRRGTQGVRDNATDALARTIATLLEVVDVDGGAQIWNAVQSEFQWSERLMTRLRKRVEATKPLIKLTVAKPAKLGTVIHMERPEPQAAQGEPMQTPGGRVTLEEAPARRRSKAA